MAIMSSGQDEDGNGGSKRRDDGWDEGPGADRNELRLMARTRLLEASKGVEEAAFSLAESTAPELVAELIYIAARLERIAGDLASRSWQN